MAAFVFSNFAVTTLREAVGPDDTELQLQVDDVDRFPSLLSGGKFPLVLLDSQDNVEIVYVTLLGVDGVATVERGREGTVPQSWLAGTLCRHTFTAATLIAAAGLRPTGTWSDSVNYTPGDVVVHGNISYVSRTDNINSTPSLVNTDWMVVYQPPGAASTAMSWLGAWSASTTYGTGSVAGRLGRIWQSNVGGNLNSAPILGNTDWSPVARAAYATDYEPVLAATGTNNYAVTIPATEGPEALYDGMKLKVRFANSNTGNVTLTITSGVTAFAAVPVRPNTASQIAAGGVVAGEVYDLSYDVGLGSFIATLPPGLTALAARVTAAEAQLTTVASFVPTGTILDFAGSAAPTGFLLCHGQAVSRTTYAALYTVLGDTFGAGDGSTTFNVPDLRGRVTAGVDNMGGAAAGRLTGYTRGSVGGAQTHTLTSGEMPSHSHTASGSSSASCSTDGSHQHGYVTKGETVSVESGSNVSEVWRSTSSTSSDSAGSHNHSISVSTTVSVNSTGSGAAHNNVQPTMALNKIIKT